MKRAAKLARALSEQHGLLQPRGAALVFLGWALARSGDTEKGTARVEEGLGIWRGMGFRVFLPLALCLLAECHLMARRHADGLESVSRALEVASETGEQWCLPRVHQARAELLLQAQRGDDMAAEASLRNAIAVAQQQSARAWELRATTRLARSGAMKEGTRKSTSCSPRFSVGSPKASTRPT